MSTKFFKSIVAAALSVLAIACAKEQAVTDSQSQSVSFTIAAPGAPVTKAYGVAEKATDLYYQVFDKDGNVIEGLGVQKTTLGNSKNATVNFQLVKDQTYKFVFWAQTTETGYYTIDATDGLKKITANYTDKSANDENFDAFFATETMTITGPVSKTVTLKRPFAQINIATSDKLMAGTTTKDLDFNGAESEVTVKQVPSVFAPLAVAAEEQLTVPVDVTFASAAVPEGNLAITGKTETYKHLAVNYVFAPAEGTVYDLEATLKVGGKEVSLKVPSTPAKRNWRTNIYGSLLTTTADFTVIVDPDFVTPDTNVEVVNVASVAAANEAFAAGQTNVNVNAVEDGATTIVLPMTDAGVGITLPAAAGKSLTVVYADEATDVQKPQTVNINAQDVQDLTIEAPATHVELNGIKADKVTASTSDNTLVVGEDAIITTLDIKKGSAVIYGSVTTLTKAEDAGNVEWHVKTAADVAAAAGKADVIVFDNDVDFGNQKEIQFKTPTTIINNAALTFNTAWQFDNFSEMTLKGNGSIHSKIRGIINNSKGAKLHVIGGTYSMEQNNRGAVFYNNYGAEMTLDNVTVNSTFYAVAAEGNVTINGGKFTSTAHNGNGAWAYTIKALNGGALTITDAEVYGVQGCIAGHDASTVVLTNVRAEARNIAGYTGNKAFNAVYSSSSTVTTINSGTYLSDNPARCVNVGDAKDTEAPNGKIDPVGQLIIKGGTFSHEFPKAYLAQGLALAKDGANWVVKEKDSSLVYDTADFEAALAAATQSQPVTLTLAPGAAIELNNGIANEGNKARTVTIIGDGSQTFDVISKATNAEGGMLSYQRGSSFELKNVKVKCGEGQYDGVVCGTMKFEDCTFTGKLTLYGNGTFKNCVFDNTMNSQYSLWTYGGNKVIVEGCTFKTTNGKAIKVYGNNETHLTVSNTQFTNTGKASKAAVETATDYANSKYNIEITRCEVTGFAQGKNTDSVYWSNASSMTTERLSVTIDEKKVF